MWAIYVAPEWLWRALSEGLPYHDCVYEGPHEHTSPLHYIPSPPDHPNLTTMADFSLLRMHIKISTQSRASLLRHSISISLEITGTWPSDAVDPTVRGRLGGCSYLPPSPSSSLPPWMDKWDARCCLLLRLACLLPVFFSMRKSKENVNAHMNVGIMTMLSQIIK